MRTLFAAAFTALGLAGLGFGLVRSGMVKHFALPVRGTPHEQRVLLALVLVLVVVAGAVFSSIARRR